MIRQRLPELMDAADVDPRAHEHALRALNRVNRLLGVDHRLLREVRRLVPAGGASVLDLGAGGGGFLSLLANGSPTGGAAPLVGLDRSLYALSRGRNWHRVPIQWVVGDARFIPLADRSVDVVTCSLFLHHFDAEEAIRVLREAARVARRGIVVGDLSRSRLAWGVTWLATHVLSRSHLFHVDGPRSVQAALRADELEELARQAGVTNARIEACFPFRLILTWKKPEGWDAAS